MPRQLRVQFPGAIYHIMSRGCGIFDSMLEISGRAAPWKKSDCSNYVLLVTFAIMFSGPTKISPPHYNGRSLEQWRRIDFHKFREAALAMGTNAIPYLVSELSATDPPIRTLPQRAVERLVSVGEVFTTFRGRRFDASCVLMCFETNAIPAVVSEAFSAAGPGKGDLVMACAEILARCKSAEGNAMIEPVLLDALRSDNEERIHTALLLSTFGEQQSAEIMKEVSRIESNPAGRVQEGINFPWVLAEVGNDCGVFRHASVRGA